MLGTMGIGRKIKGQETGRCVLREEFEPYSTVINPENGCLILNNSYFWDVFPADSVGYLGPTPSKRTQFSSCSSKWNCGKIRNWR